MAKKKTVTELRAEAETLINKAKEIERDEDATIGKYIRNIANNGFRIEYELLQLELNSRFGLLTGNIYKKSSGTNNLNKGAE